LKDYAEASKSYDAYIVLANAYKNNGDNNTASTYFDLALETSKTPEAYRNVADFYRSIENYSKSNQLLDQLTKIATDYATLAQAYRVMAENYGNLNNTSKKIEAYDKSLTYEKRVDVALTLANHYHSAQNWNRVINYTTQALSLEPNNSSALILRGNAYVKTKNNAAAKNDLNRIVNDPVHGKTAQAILKALK
jgi:tetratricopeptide (TPR) repeat protein